jgi:hypothetical protein
MALVCLCAGCASTGLNAARANFSAGRLDMAVSNLQETAKGPNVDRVLVLMERGTIQQARGKHAEAVRDWVAAAKLAEQLDYYSVGKGSASMVVNDSVTAFRGVPFERTLTRTFCAISYMMMSLWDDAAVEARNIVELQQRLEGFPDDAFSHYVAGLAFEMIDDSNNARIEFERAATLAAGVPMDPASGRTGPAPAAGARELIVLAGLGRIQARHGGAQWDAAWGGDPHVEMVADGKVIGRTRLLTDAGRLSAATDTRLAALRAAKTASRVVLKEALAESIERQNRGMGELVRLILFAMERPDERRWELLPLWLQVGRAALPDKAGNIDLVFRGNGGREIERRRLTGREPSRRATSVIFVRNPPTGTWRESTGSGPQSRPTP